LKDYLSLFPYKKGWDMNKQFLFRTVGHE